jgi:hypothetical protein
MLTAPNGALGIWCPENETGRAGATTYLQYRMGLSSSCRTRHGLRQYSLPDLSRLGILLAQATTSVIV